MTSGDTTGTGHMRGRVTITGTRNTSNAADDGVAELFAAYLQPFAGAGTHFHLGGAAGIDTAALRWLAAHSDAALTVVVPGRVADQPEPAAAAIGELAARQRLARVVELLSSPLDSAAYHARNRWMVERSDFVIGFPHRTIPSSGTWYTLELAAEQGKPRLVVPVGR